MAAARARETKVKARSDAYTGMLLISLLFMILGSVLLYLDYTNLESSKPANYQPGARTAPAPPSGPPQDVRPTPP